MYALTFQPWVGKSYHNGGIFGKKIMALGDSHYGTKQNANITREVLGWYLDKSIEREGWMNTYLKFERSLVGRETTAEESNDIWQSILFYNYLQVLLTQPREAGTDKQYKDSSAAFMQVLEQYQPELVIVWGKRLWQKLPNENWTDAEAISITYQSSQLEHEDIGYYTLPNGHIVRCLCVYHPSAGYDWSFWHKVIKTMTDF